KWYLYGLFLKPMAIHRLSIDEFDEVNYQLVAIHTSLEDYHLAYVINQNLPVLLSKSSKEIQASTKDGDATFSRYIFEDEENDIIWNLIQNKNQIQVPRKSGKTDLFTTADIATLVYLLPEFKKVDYFLKIENTDESLDELIAELQTAKQISTIYMVDASQIKSK